MMVIEIKIVRKDGIYQVTGILVLLHTQKMIWLKEQGSSWSLCRICDDGDDVVVQDSPSPRIQSAADSNCRGPRGTVLSIGQHVTANYM